MKVKEIIYLAAAVIFLIMLIIFPYECSEGISKGLSYSCSVIIPSLFPYIVLSSFIMKSRADVYIGKVIKPVTKYLFNLPECAGTALIMSFIGGFPVGAKCTSLLYEKHSIDKKTAERMMRYCVCSGPAFMITAIGAVMLKNVNAGIILYVSQIISGILIGFFSGIAERSKKNNETYEKIISENKQNNGSIISYLIEASSDGASSVISMTSLILLFSLIENVIRKSGIYEIIAELLGKIGANTQTASVIVPVILEVTGGCHAVKNASLPLWYFSLCAGFGGMCVHFQIFEIIKNIPISRWKYIIYRCINSVLSSVITFIICCIYKPTAETFAVGGGDEAFFSGATYAGSAALIIMSVIFVLSMRISPLILKSDRK